MASPAYYVWAGGGKPYRLCRPAAALQSTLRSHGLTVYDYPDYSHLVAEPPEDHTPFSATGWPVQSAYGIAHAIDIMPRADTVAGRAENAAIARRLIADRNAGVSGVGWIKYLNWTDEQGVCRQERWMPSHETRSSTDRGHIHISARSDCDDDARADRYNPMEDSMAEVYGLAGDPGDGRTTPTRVVDLWIGEQEATGVKGYGSPTARTARLIRMEQKINAVADQVAEVKAAVGAPVQIELDADAEERIAQRAAELVAAKLGALVFKAQ